MSLFIGIDPGLQGGVAVIPGKTMIEPRAWVMPVAGNELAIREFQADLRHYAGLCPTSEILCCLEWAQAMPKQGVTAMFNYGMGFGMLRASLSFLNIPYALVRPTTWKKRVLQDTARDKDASISLARSLYPSVSLRRTIRCQKDHDGMAEALLLAHYAKNHLLHKENA